MSGRRPLDSVRKFLSAYDRYLVAGHKEPDGDCITSQLATATLVGSLGGEAVLLSAGPFDRPEIEDYAPHFQSTPPVSAPGPRGTAVVIVDCSTPDRTGAVGPALAGLPALVIDHHSTGEEFGDVRYVDPTAPSTTMLVFSLFEAFGVRPDREVATLILLGLCTDTGFFRHLGPGAAETFHAIARLTDLGTSTAEVYMMVYGRRSLASRRLLATMLLRAESLHGGRLLVTWQTMADRADLPASSRGDEDLYRLLQTVAGNLVVAHIKEEGEGRWSVGLRSAPGVDVGKVAGAFKGGGHRQAAGFDINGTLASVRSIVIAAIEPLLPKETP